MAERQYSKHHIRPRSRFPSGTPKEAMDRDNIVELPDDVHQALHFIFGNATKEESIELLGILLTPNRSWSYRDIIELRKVLRRDKCSSM